MTYTLKYLLACLCLVCACKQDPLATLPDFSFRLADSLTIMNSRSIPDDRPIVLFSFEADCRGCQLTTDSLLRQMDEVKHVRFYFLTIQDFKNVTLFNAHYHLKNYPNITIGQDYDKFLPRHFKSYHTPFIALYHQDKSAAGYFDGEPAIHTLITAIKKLN